jgi:hypothetical protein
LACYPIWGFQEALLLKGLIIVFKDHGNAPLVNFVMDAEYMDKRVTNSTLSLSCGQQNRSKSITRRFHIVGQPSDKINFTKKQFLEVKNITNTNPTIILLLSNE